MNKHLYIWRLSIFLMGVFISIEFLILIISILLMCKFYLPFRSLGWFLVMQKEIARIYVAIPLSVFIYIAKTGKEIRLPKGDCLPDSIEDWIHSKSILDFIHIGLMWALLNLIISIILFSSPSLIHSGRFFIVALASVFMCIYQAFNFYTEEIKFKTSVLRLANKS